MIPERTQNAPGSNGAGPVSLVVPIKNEAASIERLLQSIAAQMQRPDEVILVDGGSTDGTVGLISGFMRTEPSLRLIEAGEATPGRGRNIGIEAARHEWIALTDAGILLDPAWLRELLEAAGRSPQARVIYGNYEPVTDSRVTEWAALAYVPAKQHRPGGRMRGPFVASMLLHREVWRAAGGFPDLRAAEDVMFMERINALATTAWAPAATVYWMVQPTLRATFDRFALYSCHNVWANRQADWHYGILTQYLLALPFLWLAVTHRFLWMLIPLSGFAARVVKSLWVKREGRGAAWLLNPIRLAGVALMLLVIDCATFVGWGKAGIVAHPSSGRRDDGGPCLAVLSKLWIK